MKRNRYSHIFLAVAMGFTINSNSSVDRGNQAISLSSAMIQKFSDQKIIKYGNQDITIIAKHCGVTNPKVAIDVKNGLLFSLKKLGAPAAGRFLISAVEGQALIKPLADSVGLAQAKKSEEFSAVLVGTLCSYLGNSTPGETMGTIGSAAVDLTRSTALLGDSRMHKNDIINNLQGQKDKAMLCTKAAQLLVGASVYAGLSMGRCELLLRDLAKSHCNIDSNLADENLTAEQVTQIEDYVQSLKGYGVMAAHIVTRFDI